MTMTIARWLPTLFLVWLLLTGCSSLPGFTPPLQDVEADRFVQGVDRYIASGDLTILRQITEHSPLMEWRAKAETLINMDHRLKQLEQQWANAEEVLARCQLEKNHLLQDNQVLETTLSQLKELLIDTEQRAE
jgi:hypothetical protein